MWRWDCRLPTSLQAKRGVPSAHRLRHLAIQHNSGSHDHARRKKREQHNHSKRAGRDSGPSHPACTGPKGSSTGKADATGGPRAFTTVKTGQNSCLQPLSIVGPGFLALNIRSQHLRLHPADRAQREHINMAPDAAWQCLCANFPASVLGAGQNHSVRPLGSRPPSVAGMSQHRSKGGVGAYGLKRD